MYLSRLIPNPDSHEFRRDHADLHHMHRTVMSGFPRIDDDTPRAHHGVLWRLDPAGRGHTLYVQSRTRPNWDHLGHYLARPADVRELKPVIETLSPGRTLAFRLTANPTKRLRLDDKQDPERTGGRTDNRYPIRKPDAQIAWLINQGTHSGFIIPASSDARPDLALTPAPRLTGKQNHRGNKITIDQVRYDGHLVVTDPDALIKALTTGIGPAKSYGCGLLTLAPTQKV